MGLFGGLFDKKSCSVCGKDIGRIFVRKLEDGYLCKECTGKLSPFFSERRESTVEEIKGQLAYREENERKLADFNPTRTIGHQMKVFVDEAQEKFVITRARNFRDGNPDIIDLKDVTGCEIDTKESRTEIMKEEKGPDGKTKRVSYNPSRYIYRYEVDCLIRVNSPYFSEIRFDVTDHSIEMETGSTGRVPDPMKNTDFVEAMKMAEDIKATLLGVREEQREERKKAKEPKAAVICPYCGATTKPDASGCCEYCGGPLG